jgi:hypothetical protein
MVHGTVGICLGGGRGKAELGLMKWMHCITIGGVLALLVKTIFG